MGLTWNAFRLSNEVGEGKRPLTAFLELKIEPGPLGLASDPASWCVRAPGVDLEPRASL